MRKLKQKKVIMTTMIFLILFLAFILITPNVKSESLPHRFKGFATDTTLRHIKDDVEVKAIVVNVDGSLEEYTTVVNSSLSGVNYDFNVDDAPPEEDNSGQPVYFYIGAENTTQWVPFVVGGLNENYSTYFNITIIDRPQITNDYTNRTNGTTGDPFYFNVSVLDYVDDSVNLTVNVSWAHNGTSGNESLSNTFGDYFTSSITLGHNITNMIYTIWINDSSGNFNSSGPHNVTVTDNDPPVTSLEIGEPLHPNGVTNNSNITSSSNIYLNTTDNIGFYYIHYRIWNSTNGWSSWTVGSADTNQIINLAEEGKNYFEYYANDTAGNNETTHNVTLWVDDTAPTTTLTINEQVHPSSQTGCNVTSSTTMILSPSDNPAHSSGVASTAYRYWNSSSGWTTWTAYSGAFTLGADEGKYYLEFNSTDNLGNAESSNNWTIWVDNTAPTSTIDTNYAYYHNSSLIITISVNASNEVNRSGIKNVTLYFYYNSALNNSSKANTSWEGPFAFNFESANVNSTPWINLSAVSISFNFSNLSGYYRFFSAASDNLTNNENTSIWVNQTNSTECFFNNTVPNAPQILSGPTSRNTGVSGTYAVNATDIDNDRLKFGWDWNNDGIVNTWDDNDTHYYASGEIASISKSWSSTGTKTFKVVAVDEHGAWSNWSSTYSVTVSSSSSGGNGNPPVYVLTADAGGPYTGETGTPVTFTGSATYGSKPYSYSWDFGDGNTGTGQTINHTYSSAGTYTVTLTVTDNNDNTDGDTATATITQSSTPAYPPVADAGGLYDGLTYQDIVFDGSNSSDVDGSIQNYTWDLGDGTILYGEQVTHAYDNSGLFNISLTVTDDDGLTNTDITTINISLDTDADGWSDEIEESYGTNISDSSDGPTDTDEDGTPDEDSPDGKYQGDADDDNDGVSDEMEELIGTDPLSKEIFTTIEIDGKSYYLIDTDGDGTPDRIFDIASEKDIAIKVNNDGTILIDVDGDGGWDYIYDSSNGAINTYKKEKPKGEIPIIPIIIIIVIILLIIIVFLFKIGYLYFEDKK